MIDKSKTLASFYEMLRMFFMDYPEIFMIIHYKDGRSVRLKIVIDEQKERCLKIVKEG